MAYKRFKGRPYTTGSGRGRTDANADITVYADGQWLVHLDPPRQMRGPDAESLKLWLGRMYDDFVDEAKAEQAKAKGRRERRAAGDRMGHLQCCECGRVSREDERGWTARLTIDDEVAVFCRKCDQIEFGGEED